MASRPAHELTRFDPDDEEFFRAGDSSPPVAFPDDDLLATDDSEWPHEREQARRPRRALVASIVAVATVIGVMPLVRGSLTRQPSTARHEVPSRQVSTPLAQPPRAPLVDPPLPTPAQSPRDEREAARGALERHDTTAAIDRAKRAITLDEADAESWLILGAAQLEAHQYADARATFLACARHAKNGPIAECRSLLR